MVSVQEVVRKILYGYLMKLKLKQEKSRLFFSISKLYNDSPENIITATSVDMYKNRFKNYIKNGIDHSTQYLII